MNKQTRPKKQAVVLNTITPSHINTAPSAVITANLRKKIAPKSESAVGQFEALCRVGDFLLMNRPSFGLSDFHKHCRGHCEAYNISFEQVREFFDTWSSYFVQYGKLEPVNGVYDEQIFIVQSR